jgi:hypothetical protein
MRNPPWDNREQRLRQLGGGRVRSKSQFQPISMPDRQVDQLAALLWRHCLTAPSVELPGPGQRAGAARFTQISPTQTAALTRRSRPRRSQCRSSPRTTLRSPDLHHPPGGHAKRGQSPPPTLQPTRFTSSALRFASAFGAATGGPVGAEPPEGSSRPAATGPFALQSGGPRPGNRTVGRGHRR